MLRSSLCNNSDAYIIGNGTITVENPGTTAAPDSWEKNYCLKLHSIYWLYKQNKQYTNR